MKYVILILSFISVVLCAGPCVHNEVGHRALYWLENAEFKQILQDYSGTMEVGCTFPDWGYYPECRNWSLVSDYSHCQVFVNDSIMYLKNRFPTRNQWTGEAKELVSLLFGSIAHQVADILWHGSVMYDVIRCNNDVQKPGLLCEDYTGCELSLPWLHDKWIVPSETLAKIYQEQGFHYVKAIDINFCVDEMRLVKEAELLGAEELFDHYAQQSPFAVDQLTSYFKGGIDEMAFQTLRCWQDFIGWFETQYDLPTPSEIPWCLLEQFPTSKFSNQISSVRPKQGIAWKEPKEVEKKEVEARAAVCAPLDELRNSVQLKMAGNYSYFGTAMTIGDFNGDGVNELEVANVLGTPGKPAIGAIFLFPGDSLTKDIEVSQPVSTGTEADERYGTALATVDFNCDGFDDLAVSSPNFGSESLTFEGKVSIYFGSKEGLPSIPDTVIYGDANDGIINFGWHLQHGFVNEGSPYSSHGGYQTGSLHVYLSSKEYHNSELLTPTQAEISVEGSQPYSWFGYHSLVVEENGKKFLVVGAPVMKIDGRQSTGAIFGYDLSTDFSQPAFAVYGQNEFDQLGFSFDSGNLLGGNNVILAVGVPTYTTASRIETFYQSGQVLLFPFADLISSQNTSVTSTINNFHTQSRFGFSVLVEDLNGDGIEDLVVGEPMRSDPWPVTNPIEFGSFYGFLGGKDFPTGEVDSDSADWCVNSMIDHMRYGTAVIAGDLDGNGKNDLIVSGPRFSELHTTWSGLVHVEFR